MKIFITGASGYIGRHVTQLLTEKGHLVSALTRTKKQSDSTNLNWVEGSLESIGELKGQLGKFDAIIHLAMDYKSGAENTRLDQIVVETFIDSGVYFIYTGNLFNSAKPGEKIEEHAYPDENSCRITVENKVLASKSKAAIIRPGFVYGGSGGFLWQMISTQADGKLHFVDNSSTCWPMIHVEDLARLYLHVIENQLSGIFHGTDGEETKAVDVVDKLAKLYQSPLKKVSFEQAEPLLGKVATFMTTDFPVETSITLSSGWTPEKINFVNQAEQAYKDYLTWKN